MTKQRSAHIPVRIGSAALACAFALLTVACSDSQKIGGASTTLPASVTTVVADSVSGTVAPEPTTTAPAPAPTIAPVPPTAAPLAGSALAGPTNLVTTPGGGNWVQSYWAEEAGPGIWSSVTVVLGDFHFDDGAEVWVGYRYDGSGGYLDIDVLDALPDGSFFLGGLQGLDHGQVDVRPGGATVVTALYADGEPNCCPGNFLVREVTFASSQWQIGGGTTYAADAVPAVVGDF